MRIFLPSSTFDRRSDLDFPSLESFFEDCLEDDFLDEDYDVFDIIAYGLDGEYILHEIVQKFSEKNYNRSQFMSDFAVLQNIRELFIKKIMLRLKIPQKQLLKIWMIYLYQQEIFFLWKDIYRFQINIKDYP